MAVSAQDRFKEQVKLRAAFVPCKSKEALALWIAEYLGLEFPDVKVDEDSTTTPMDYIWTVYEKAMHNIDPSQSRILAYASRDSFKTLGTAVIEFLMLVHLGRDVGHMAAIEKQARQATGYVQNFFNKPYFRPFVVGNNQRTKEFIRYDHKETGDHIPKRQWDLLTPVEQVEYTEYKTKLDIVICTPQGANGLHVPFFVVDEVDLASPSAYEEAKMIPTSTDDRAAITALTSTRKYAFGLVQNEIDNAPKTGLKILHWNILDIAKKCDPKRHRPDLPKKKVHVNKDLLKIYTPEQYGKLAEEAKELCVEEEAFDGCLTNCSLYAMCRGRLATVQQGPKFPQAVNLQKPIDHLIAQFKAVSEPVANAQLLCRKPSQMGLIYPFLDRDVHVKTPAEIAGMITGDEFHEGFTKGDLMALLMARGTKLVCGMDFGFTHNWACPMVAVDGRRAFVLGCLAEPQLMTNQQIERFQAAFGEYSPEVYADPENPQAVKEFKHAGVDMKKWSKGPGSVLAGIEVVRWMIRPLIGEPLLYFLDGQPDVDFLFLRLQQYHWKVSNQTGNPTDEPDETNDDECDALRYALMNKFINGRTTVKAVQVKPAAEALKETAQRVHRQQILEHATGGNMEIMNQGSNKPVRKGRLIFSLG